MIRRFRSRERGAPDAGQENDRERRGEPPTRRGVRVWDGSVPRRGRLRVRDELPLLALSRGDGVGVQSVRGYRAGEAGGHRRPGPAPRLRGGRLEQPRCAVGGSLLYSLVRESAYMHLALGSLVDAPSIQPTKHIFIGSKAPWFEITDTCLNSRSTRHSRRLEDARSRA